MKGKDEGWTSDDWAKEISQVIEDSGLSVAQIAVETGIPFYTVSGFMAGQGLTQLERIDALLGCCGYGLDIIKIEENE